MIMRTQLTKATLRRELRLNFFAYVDYTLRWQSDNMEMLEDDPTLQLIDAIHHYMDWDVCSCLMPRGIGKTTIEVLGQTWKKWRHPVWLMHLLISATPDVTRDCYVYCEMLCRTHPLLDELRPRRADQTRKDIDTKHRRGKGVCFRFRTAGTTITGGRAHEVDVDDLEIRETVATPTQREKMLLVVAEVHNLHIKGHWYKKDLIVGTPWDQDTMYRKFKQLKSDIHIETAAYLPQPDGTTIFPYKRLTEGDLKAIKLRLNNDPLFRSQYGLDTTRDEESQPISADKVRFAKFEAGGLDERMLILDPAGGKSSAEERSLMRTGERRGDGMTIMACGIHYAEMRVLDIFSQPCSTDEYLDTVCDWCTRFGVWEVWVEGNLSAWKDLLRVTFQARGIAVYLDDFWSSTDKLTKVLDALMPVFGAGAILFHERLREHEALHEQLMGLRFHRLPRPNDDVVDVIAMGITRLMEYLMPAIEARADEERQMKEAHAPRSVIHSARIVEAQKEGVMPLRVGQIVESADTYGDM